MFRIGVYLTAIGQFGYFTISMILNPAYRIDRPTMFFACLFSTILFGTLTADRLTEKFEKSRDRVAEVLAEHDKREGR